MPFDEGEGRRPSSHKVYFFNGPHVRVLFVVVFPRCEIGARVAIAENAFGAVQSGEAAVGSHERHRVMSYASVGIEVKIEHAYFIFRVSEEGFTEEVVRQHVVGFNDDGVVAEGGDEGGGIWIL
jgi:hypothetical protein